MLVPGLAVAALIALTVREPSRVQAAAGAEAQVPDWREALRQCWRLRTLRYVLLGSALFSAVGTGTTAFLPAFLIRDRGLTTMQVGSAFGVAMGLSGGVGLLVPALGALGIIPLLSSGILSPDPWTGLLLMTPGFVLSGLYYGPAFAIVQNLSHPGLRALSAALMYVALTGVGQSLGPMFVGIVSDRLAPYAGAASLPYALIAVQGGLVLGAIAYFAASRHIAADLARQAAA
jgi:hypothetical protein